MAGAKASAAAKSGLLRRLFRIALFLLGFLTIVGILDYFITSRAVRGSWQFHAPQLSQNTVDRMIDSAEHRVGARRPGEERRLGKGVRDAISQIGQKMMGAVAQQVQLEVVDGGYRIDGGVGGARAAAALIANRGGPDASISGCLSGTYIAAFPFVRATCGDGSGRTLWFLIKGWPSEELRLFPLPVGNDELQARTRKMMEEGGGDRSERLEAANELLTLRFTRIRE